MQLTVLVLSGLGLLAACASPPWTWKVHERSLDLADVVIMDSVCVRSTEGNRMTEAETGIQSLQHLAKGSKLNCTGVDWTLKSNIVFPVFRRVLRSA